MKVLNVETNKVFEMDDDTKVYLRVRNLDLNNGKELYFPKTTDFDCVRLGDVELGKIVRTYLFETKGSYPAILKVVD